MTSAIAPSASTADLIDDRVAAALRGYLAQERITKRELAARLHQTPFWVGRRLNGQTAISVGELMLISEVLGESVGRFLPDPRDLRERAAANLGGAGARSSTDRASDYGSRVGRFAPPRRRGRRSTDRHLSVVPLPLTVDIPA